MSSDGTKTSLIKQALKTFFENFILFSESRCDIVFNALIFVVNSCLKY